MPRQTVPDIDFDHFALGEIQELFDNDKIFINESYQRGDIWKDRQKIELIKSIDQRYSIGVLVLFINEKDQYEILDGQQRLLTIKSYLSDEIKGIDDDLTKYSELSRRDKLQIDAYSVYYLKLKSHDPETKEEDIVQTFLRLQEGTPLNKAEKLNAHRGEFKNVFKDIAITHPLFKFLGTERRFRFRQLAAELMTLEFEGDFDNLIFPSLDIHTLTGTIKKYEKKVPKRQLKFFKGNLDYMHNSINMLLGAFKIRDVISFYLLISYLRKKRAGNNNLNTELSAFAKEFMCNLNKFSIYDLKPPRGMTKKEFDTYKSYKTESKLMTTPASFKTRLEIMISEFDRLLPIIEKDPERLHNEEQRRILFFRQRGICPECSKSLDFKKAEAHHVIHHSKGGITDDLEHSVLLHTNCHKRVHKREKKKQTKLDI
ncbi:HNH endonuclease family protein [Maribacter cobaltidurans]|uniref:Uncharacterized protein n=1 Tax=Maribacter cobaltidurans TaxID=1178778 RepID=A0A223V3R0_9FLAO|nr:DUF262 domain-containing protein [Maribacter cobaltidurans]ASV29877.1 hypothetical protein CJ263_06385 [Maribacter cobaltidurans]GGD88982.1 hypothetical protein GCM10011412_28630 [Maribacter cobaltidurans]